MTRRVANGSRVRRALHWYAGLSPARQMFWKIAIIVLLFVTGMGLRSLCWEVSKPIRYEPDLDNAWRLGTHALQLGHGDTFAGIVAVYNPAQKAHIDYPPLRMYIKTFWVRYIKDHYGPKVPRTDAVMWPMLLVNLVFGIAASVGMYFFCRLRSGRWLSLLAACCLWFNPAVIFGAFGFPQWDTWSVAPLIWAAWALFRTHRPATLFTDLLAGLLIGFSAMLKGQTFIVLPWFLLVTLGFSLFEPRPFGRNPRAALRGLLALTRLALIAVGILLAIFVITLPFTLRGSTDWQSIYNSKVTHEPILVVSGCNIPHILQDQFNMHSGDPITLPLLGAAHAVPLYKVLAYSFGLWTLIVAAVTVWRRRSAACLMGLGLVFAGMFALMPEMHERYTTWTAAFLASTVCVGFDEVILYGLITGISFFTTLHTCLNYQLDILPMLRKVLNHSYVQMACFWVFCALLLTWQIFTTRRNKPSRLTHESTAECPAASCPPLR